MKDYLVLDTNIILLDANNLLTLGKDYTIVLPETVVDEIDSKKTSSDPELRFQVREFGRIMARRVMDAVKTTEDGILSIVPFTVDGVNVEVASLTKYEDIKDVEPSIRNDRKIIAIADAYNKYFGDTTFMSNDAMCQLRAASFGFPTTDHKLVNKYEHEFAKELTIDPDTFAKLHNIPINEVDPEYTMQNYNYVFKDSLTSQTKLGNIRNGYIDILGKDTETELRRQDVTPMNSGQLFLSRAIQNPHIDIVVCEALAGSGKTVSAFSNAIRLVKKGEYGGISYIRASVDDADKAEQLGFRSGNDEKVAPFFHPVDDSLDFIVRSRFKDSKLKGKDYEEFIEEQVDTMKEKYNISATTTLGMRGRTFTNTIAIIDEAQNMSKASLQKVLTRFGKNCKIIIVGSNKQIDNPYITKFTNGLSVILDACTKEQDTIKLHAVPLTKVLRSDIAEFAEKVFAK